MRIVIIYLDFPAREYYYITMKRIENSNDIGTLVLARRKELGLTQKEASGLCGVGIRFWSELENGKNTLQLGKVLSILSRLGIDITAKVRP